MRGARRNHDPSSDSSRWSAWSLASIYAGTAASTAAPRMPHGREDPEEKGGDPRALENPKYGILSEDGERLRVTKEVGSVEMLWTNVEEVHAFKRDLYTTDLICLAFKREGTNEYIEIHEEMAGYHDLLQALPGRLPGFRLDWFCDVAFAAFETNHRTIWKRSTKQVV